MLARLDGTLHLKCYQGFRGPKVILTSDSPEYGPLESENVEVIGVGPFVGQDCIPPPPEGRGRLRREEGPTARP